MRWLAGILLLVLLGLQYRLWVGDGSLTQVQSLREEIAAQTAELKELAALIYRHLELTESARAKEIMDDWGASQKKFLKVSPKDQPKPPAYEEELEPSSAKA